MDRRWPRARTGPPTTDRNDRAGIRLVADPGRSRRPHCGSSTSTGWCGSPASPSATWATRSARSVPAGSGWCSPPTTRPHHRRTAGPAAIGSGSRPPPAIWPRRPRAAASLLEPGQPVRVLGRGGCPREPGEARWGRDRSADGRPPSTPRWSGGAARSTSTALAATAAAARRSGRLHRHQRGSRPIRLRTVWCPGSGALLAAVATASGVTSRDRRQAPPADGRAHAETASGFEAVTVGGDDRGPAAHRRSSWPSGWASPSAWWTRG